MIHLVVTEKSTGNVTVTIDASGQTDVDTTVGSTGIYRVEIPSSWPAAPRDAQVKTDSASQSFRAMSSLAHHRCCLMASWQADDVERTVVVHYERDDPREHVIADDDWCW